MFDRSFIYSAHNQTFDQMKAHYTRQAPLAEIPIRLGRLWLGYRYSRYLLWSIAQRHGYGVSTAAKSLAKIGTLSALDLSGVRPRVECNICGWQGTRFYPNVGSGYFELNTTCARCHSIHRYRSLAAILETKTDFFSPDKAVIEVAPVRTFQACCLRRKQGKNYASFDLEGFGMEKGDITAMRYGDGSCDYFLCFHVLEHVLDDSAAIREIFRVLRPSGQAVLQVPIDHTLSETVEYGHPNWFETGHVRRYAASGFANRLIEQGFGVSKVSVDDIFDESDVLRYGFNREAIYFATKPSRAT